MTKRVMWWLVVIFSTARTIADATIRLNNKDAQMPIFLRHVGTLATPADQIYIQVLAGPVGGYLSVVTPIGATTSLIRLSVPGYFDAGIGIIPGIGDAKVVDCRIQVWQALPNSTGPGVFESAISVGSATWTQRSGSWDPKSVLAPSGPVLAMPSAVLVGAIPEPSTVALGLLGGAALVTNTVIKASKAKK